MMGSPSLEEKIIIKDVRNPFILNKLEKEANYDAIEGIRNLFSLENKSGN